MDIVENENEISSRKSLRFLPDKKVKETQIVPYVGEKSSSNIPEKLSEFLCGINPNEIEEDDKV